MRDAAALIRDLKQPWKHGEHVDARGLILEEPLVLDGLNICGVDLSGAVLKGGFSARGATFQGLAWLRDVEVRGLCDLSGVRTRSDLRCDGVKSDHIVFDECVLHGVLSLSDATSKTVSLQDSLVMASVTLENATVLETVNLSGAEIMGGLSAVGGQFGAVLDHCAAIYGRVRLPHQA